MSDERQPPAPRPDRGYYGAGWSQPQQGAPSPSGPPAGAPVAGPGAPAPGQAAPYGAQGGSSGPYGIPSGLPGSYGAQPGAPGSYGAQPGPYGVQQGSGVPYAPQRPHRRPADPRRAFAPGASSSSVVGALIAVIGLLAIELVSGLVGLIGTSLVVTPFHSFSGQSLVSSFTTAVFLAPFPFYAGAFLALTFLTPVERRSPLPVVLLRTVLAGAAGTVALSLVGVFTGAYGAVGYGPSRLVIDIVTSPLQNGIPLTAILLATATGAWLWLGRPRVAPRGPGAPGSVRPADAVPPATLPHVREQRPPQDPYGR